MMRAGARRRTIGSSSSGGGSSAADDDYYDEMQEGLELGPRGKAFGMQDCPYDGGSASMEEATAAPAATAAAAPAPAAAIIAPPLVDASQRVAEWCVGAGREQAMVAVSPSTTLYGVLKDFWALARAFSEDEGPVGRQCALALPLWAEGSADAALFQKVLQHISDCADVCEYVGETLLIAGRHPSAVPGDDEPGAAPCPMLLLRSFRQAAYGNFGDENYGMDDPFAALDDGLAFGDKISSFASDACVLGQTRAWVEGVIVDMKVCPFSVDANRAGLPVGGVTYPITHATTGEEVYERFWEQVLELQATEEKDISTVLLLTPRFGQYSAGAYDMLADTLNEALGDLGVEKDIQLVFFHPDYTFRDGKERLGDDGAANFARRSPFPMINLLRTPQVRAAQKGLPTGSVYTTNERNLEIVGVGDLQKMLDEKNWEGLKGVEFHKHQENLWK